MFSLTLPSGVDVEFRHMTGREEDLLANEKKRENGEAVSELLTNCTLRLGEKDKPKMADLDALSTPDRLALLLAIRAESYGQTVEAELNCGTCKRRFSVDVELTEIPQRPLPEEYVEDQPFAAVLSDGTTVKFKYLTGRDEKKLLKASPESLITTYMALRLVEVEGVHENGHKQWLLALPVPLRMELRNLMEDMECGPDVTRTVDCPNCNNEVSFQVQTLPGFFFPRT